MIHYSHSRDNQRQRLITVAAKKYKNALGGENMIKSSKLVNLVLVSSTVLGMVANASMASVNAASNGSTDVTQTSKIANRGGINVITKGATTFEGSNMLEGVKLSNDFSLTSGTLQINYTGTTQYSLTAGEKTKTFVSMPEEFKPLMQKTTADGKTFLDYIEDSSYFFAPNNLGEKKHTYQRSDISYDSATNTLIFQNQISLNNFLGGETLEAHIFVDLGQAITDLGERIPDAYNHSNYKFQSTVVTDDSLPDWNIIGDAEADGFINWDKLDKGWTIVNQIPTISEPVTDTDTEIIGGNAPAGSTVTIRANSENGPVVGTAIAGANGTYIIKNITKQKAGTVLYAEQTTALGTKGYGKATVVHNNSKPAAPVVDNKKVVWGNQISGKIDIPGDTIQAINGMNGNVYKVEISADGTSFTIDTSQVDKSDLPTNIEITETNGELVSDKTTVLVYQNA